MNINAKDIELTDEDFDMIIDGLKNLPNKNAAGEFAVDMISMMLMDKKNPEEVAEAKKKMELQKVKANQDRKEMEENVVILQGKLLLFKRWLIQENILKQAKDIIGQPTGL